MRHLKHKYNSQNSQKKNELNGFHMLHNSLFDRKAVCAYREKRGSLRTTVLIQRRRMKGWMRFHLVYVKN
jgi:hypothetical protein